MNDDELDELLDEHFDGTLAAPGRERLTGLLASPVARAHLVRRARFEALLHRACARPRTRTILKRRSPAPLWALPLGIAVAALLMLGIGWILMRPEPGGDKPSEIGEMQLMSGQAADVDGLSLTRIEAGGTVLAEGREPAVLRLPDGSMSSLSPGTWAQYEVAQGTRGTLKLGPGRGSFDVRPHRQPLAVTTSFGSITSSSARFSIEVRDEHQGMDVTVKSGRIEVNSGSSVLAMSQGDRRSFRGEEGGSRRSAILAGLGKGRVSLQDEPGSRRQDFQLAAAARVHIDGKAGTLTEIPSGTRVRYAADQTGITELVAVGQEVSARVVAVDQLTRRASVRLVTDDRILDLALDRIDLAGGSGALVPKQSLRVRLSLDGERALSARVLPRKKLKGAKSGDPAKAAAD